MHKMDRIFTFNQNFNDAKVITLDSAVTRASLYLEPVK